MTPSIDQARRAKTLLLECDRLKAEIAQLTALLADAELARQANADARAECLTFTYDPNRLAGLIDTYRRTDPETARLIPIRYRQMLAGLHPATTSPPAASIIDYAALTPAARPYLLGPYLNLSFGNAFPQLCLTRSDPAAGRLVYIAANGPSDETTWRQHLPAIRDWLGGGWELARHSVTAAVLEKRPPLPAALPMDNRFLANARLYLGLDIATRQHVHLPFADMTCGTFIPGATGTGKSNALHILLQSIFANLNHFAAVYLVDGKDGVAFNRYRAIAPGKVHVLWEERDLWHLTTQLVAHMRARNAAQRERSIDNATHGFIAVVIDEMSTYTAKPSGDPKHADNKLHARFIDELAMLARRGRSTGLRLFITAQEPVAEQIPATVRANCLTTISFRLPIDAHAIAVFGELQGLPADPRKLAMGRALFKHGLAGTVQHVLFPVSRRPA